ncbi:MAG: dihydroorotase [Bacteroidetes bacterium]|nr:MAG: dihydroorotase [Bacteroidota bacterium]
MKILIQQVNILSAKSPYNGMCKDVLLLNGIINKISDIGTIKEKCDEIIDGRNKHLTTGWLDLHVNFQEPGNEHKEDLLSGCHAAQQGGFTGVLCMPSTTPPVDNRSLVEFIQNRTKNQLVEVFSSGTISNRQEGTNLSEMFDMYGAGATVFTDDKKSVEDAGLMLRALLYAKNFGGKIFSFANEQSISNKGQMNEGLSSIQLGLKGIPSIAEEIMISRDLILAEYADAEIHFSGISTKKSVDLIRTAKKRGIKVTADVSYTHFSLTDSSLNTFDSDYKLMPPLRSNEDVMALIEGLKDNTIDAISSDHLPEDVENKKKEFELAKFGAEGLETCFAASYTALMDHLSKEEIIEKFTSGPRKILGLAQHAIVENVPANLTMVDLNNVWTVDKQAIFSKSKNNPFLSRTLTAKPEYIFNKDQFYKIK